MPDFAKAKDQDEWVKGIEDEDNEEALEQLKSWLLPKTDGFFQAPSGHRLHVRAVLPPSDPQAQGVKAVVLYCHGMNSHVNGRCWAADFFPQLAAEGFAVFALDILGHGYSEGTRAMIEDWDTVFTDWEEFAEALMGVAEPMPSGAEFGAGVPDEVLGRLRQLPIFVMGTSMGGMIGMHVGLRLQENERLQDRFRGAVLCCPALAADLPPKAVQILLRNLVVPLCRTKQMPSFISSSSKMNLGWVYDLCDSRQRQIAAMEIRDCAARFPKKGLGWHEGMRWATAGAFSQMYSGLDDDMEEVEYPFLVIHDRGDKVTFFEGSERLMEKCGSKDKTLQAVDAGGMHCLPMVIQEKFVADSVAWLRKHL